MSYSLTIVPSIGGGPVTTLIRRDADAAIIPADPLNYDWQAYQAWLEAGNTPAESAEAAPRKPPAKNA